jgi:hypothetical protein
MQWRNGGKWAGAVKVRVSTVAVDGHYFLSGKQGLKEDRLLY